MTETTERAFEQLTEPDGTIYCDTPDNGGPVEIGGQHPSDYFAKKSGASKTAAKSTSKSSRKRKG